MSKGDIETYHEDGQWKNRPHGNSRASNTHETKAAAEAAGRDMAKQRHVEHIIKRGILETPFARSNPQLRASVSPCRFRNFP